MGVYGHLTILPPKTFSLSQVDFTQMILALCAAPGAELPLSIYSGTLTAPVEDDPLSPPEAVTIETPFDNDASLPFPRLLPRKPWDREGVAITAWYHGSESAAIEEAMYAIPYGQEPICVTFQMYPKIVVLPAALPICFSNAWTGERRYRVASHMCRAAHQKGEIPHWLSISFAPTIERYYGEALQQIVEWA